MVLSSCLEMNKSSDVDWLLLLSSWPLEMKLSSTPAPHWITWWFLHDCVQQLSNNLIKQLDRIGRQKGIQSPNAPIRCNRAVADSFQALIGGYVSHAKRGHDLACHIWLERSGCFLTPSGEITHFRAHLPAQKIKIPELV